MSFIVEAQCTKCRKKEVTIHDMQGAPEMPRGWSRHDVHLNFGTRIRWMFCPDCSPGVSDLLKGYCE